MYAIARWGLLGGFSSLAACAQVLGYDDLSIKSEAGGASLAGAAGQSGVSMSSVGGAGAQSTGGAGAKNVGGTGASSGALGVGQGGADAFGQGGSDAFGQGGTSGGGAPGGGAGAATGGSGPVGVCANGACPEKQYCDPSDGMCKCLPGFTASGGNCVPELPGDPTKRTQAEVCGKWAWGHEITDPSPFTKGAGDCDKGTLSRAGRNDTVRRINMFRWFVGLAPTWDDGADHQACAVLAAWNPPGTVPNPHNPPPDAKCYTPEGHSGTGSSNLAWGSGHPANAINQYMRDWGNEDTFGHRRWIMNPSLAPVQIGYWKGGGPYGDAQCLGVFNMANQEPGPKWTSHPPPGYVPIELVEWDWTFHGPGASSGTLTVKRNGSPVEMTKLPLWGGFGSYETVGYRRAGWSPKPGDVLEVTFGFTTPVTFEIRPVSCP